jgi:hypothetical protein
MDLSAEEVSYFITQVGLSASSFGIATKDVTAVGNALNKFFGYKCASAESIIPTAPAELQAICIANDCPTASNATCAADAVAVEPANNTATTMGSSDVTKNSPSGSASSTANTSASASMVATSGTEGLVGNMWSTLRVLAVGVAALAFGL